MEFFFYSNAISPQPTSIHRSKALNASYTCEELGAVKVTCGAVKVKICGEKENSGAVKVGFRAMKILISVVLFCRAP
jgi:hypothetical protein